MGCTDIHGCLSAGGGSLPSAPPSHLATPAPLQPMAAGGRPGSMCCTTAVEQQQQQQPICQPGHQAAPQMPAIGLDSSLPQLPGELWAGVANIMIMGMLSSSS